MLSWAKKRQLFYGAAAIFLLVLIFAVPLLSRTIRGSSCIDGSQNGSETGVDCGGTCALLCPDVAREPRALWQRVFLEGGGIASAVLYAENQNEYAGAFDAPYQVKVYDSSGLLVAERRVTAMIPPGGTFAVFAPNLFVGERVPVRASFERTARIVWRRDMLPVNAVRAENAELSLTPQTRVDATVVNTTKSPSRAVAVALLYDASGNAVGASQTVVDDLPAGASFPVSFVWRAPVAPTPVRAEIVTAARAAR